MSYPKFLFHREKAAEGQLFASEDDLPKDPTGWVETPAAFDEGYVAPPAPDTAEGSIPEDARRRGYVPAPFPSHRYKKNDADHPKTVNSQEEDDALEAAEPGVWKHSPDPKAWADDAAPTGTATGADLATGPDAPHGLTEDQKAEFYAAKVADIVVKLGSVTGVGPLDELAAVEDQNPKGARQTIVKAIKARKAELAVPVE